MKLDVKFKEIDQKFNVNFKEVNQKFNVGFGQYVGGAAGAERYDGDYIVTPKVTEQTIPTKEKLMVDDMTVKSIPFFSASNTSGGNTVYIGREV